MSNLLDLAQRSDLFMCSRGVGQSRQSTSRGDATFLQIITTDVALFGNIAACCCSSCPPHHHYHHHRKLKTISGHLVFSPDVSLPIKMIFVNWPKKIYLIHGKLHTTSKKYHLIHGKFHTTSKKCHLIHGKLHTIVLLISNNPHISMSDRVPVHQRSWASCRIFALLFTRKLQVCLFCGLFSPYILSSISFLMKWGKASAIRRPLCFNNSGKVQNKRK